MRQEEATRLIEQQVMEMRFQLAVLQAQLLPDLANGLFEELLPIGIGQREVLRGHVPDAPDLRVNERLLALAVGRLLAMFFQRFRLLNREGQGNRSKAVDFQPRQHCRSTAADTEGTRSINPLQHLAKFLGNRVAHGGLLRRARPRWAASPSDTIPGLRDTTILRTGTFTTCTAERKTGG